MKWLPPEARALGALLFLVAFVVLSTANADTTSVKSSNTCIPGSSLGDDVPTDIYCLQELRTRPSSNKTHILVKIPVYLNTYGSTAEDVQILAVAARFAQFLVNNDSRFTNEKTQNNVKVDVQISYDGYVGNGNWDGKRVFEETLCALESANVATTPVEGVRTISQTALLGPYTSFQSRFLSSIATIRTAPLVSFSATVPGLSSKYDYPWFYRVIYDDTQRMNAFKSLMDRFNWHSVSVLAGSDTFSTAAVNSLSSALTDSEISVYRFGNQAIESANAIAKGIDKSGWKIIFLVGGNELQSIVTCLTTGKGPNCTNEVNLTRENGYTWILMDAFPLLEVTPEFCHALRGSIVLSNAPTLQWMLARTSDDLKLLYRNNDYNESLSVRGASHAPSAAHLSESDIDKLPNIWPKPVKDIWIDALESFKKDFETDVFFPEHIWRQDFVPFVIDSVYAIANAYWNLLMDKMDPNGCSATHYLKKVAFYGFTGFVGFNEQQDRSRAEIYVWDMPPQEEHGGSCSDISVTRPLLGKWSSLTGLELKNTPKLWGGEIPKDGFQWRNAPPAVKFTVGLAVCFFIIASTALPTLFVMIKFRSTRFIRGGPISFFALLVFSLAVLALTLLVISGGSTPLTCVFQYVLATLGSGLVIATLGAKAFIYELANKPIGSSSTAHKRFGRNHNARVLLVTAIFLGPTILTMMFVLIFNKPVVVTSLKDSTYSSKCSMKGIAGKAATIAVVGLTAAAAAILAYRNRDFNRVRDAKHILFALGNTILVGAVTMLIVFLTKGTPSVVVSTVFVAITIGSLITCALIIVPRALQIYSAHKKGTLWMVAPAKFNSGVTSHATDSLVTSRSQTQNSVKENISRNDSSVVELENTKEDPKRQTETDQYGGNYDHHYNDDFDDYDDDDDYEGEDLDEYADSAAQDNGKLPSHLSVPLLDDKNNE